MLAGLIWKNLPELKNQSDMLVHGSTDHMKANVMHSPSVRETVPNAEKLSGASEAGGDGLSGCLCRPTKTATLLIMRQVNTTCFVRKLVAYSIERHY